MSKFRRNKEMIRSSNDYNNNSNNGGSAERKVSQTKVMPHDEFIKRVKKSLYYGSSQMSIPLSDYMTDRFSDSHKGYSLNRLNYDTVGQLKTTPYSLILALIYLERLKETDPAYTKHITPTELFLVSMLVSTKFYNGYDEDVVLSDWAEYGNLTNEQLKKIELEFLSALNWNLYVSNEEFFRKLFTIETILATNQGLHRGWFTYVELNHLLPPIAIVKSLIQYTLILAMSYAAFVTTIAGSIFLASQVPGTSLYASSITTATTTTAPTSTATTTSTATIDDEIKSETELNTNPRSMLDDAEMNLMLSQNVPSYNDRLKFASAGNSTYSDPFNLSKNQYEPSNNYPTLIFNQPDKIFHDGVVNEDSNGIRTGFNLRSFLFGDNDEIDEQTSNNIGNRASTKRRNRTGYDWLMQIEKRDITAEFSSCKNDFGLALHWRKLL